MPRSRASLNHAATRRLRLLSRHLVAADDEPPAAAAAAAAVPPAESGAPRPRVRLALIGVGSGAGGSGIGERHLNHALAESQAFEVVAVADPADRGAEICAMHGLLHYRDTEAMLREVKPDAAVLAVPNHLHVPVGLQCVAHGVHVLVEKPLAPTVAEGKELVDAAQAKGVLVAVGHHRRFDPAVRGAKRLLDPDAEEGIGQLLNASVMWCLRKPDDYYALEHRRQAGAGPLTTNLSHDIDTLRFLCGEVEEVMGFASNRLGRGGVNEDSAALLLRFRSGGLASVSISDAAPSPWNWESSTGENDTVPYTQGANCYRFVGTKGSLDFPTLELWRHVDQNGGPEGVGDGGVGNWADSFSKLELEVPERQPLGSWRAELLAFGEAVAAGDVDLSHAAADTNSSITSGMDGLATVAAMEAVLQAVEEGGLVKPEYTLAQSAP